MVEFVLVAALVVTVGIAVLQIVLATHVRSTLKACAAEGARTAAVARLGDDAGADRALECAASSLGRDVEVAVAHDAVGGRDTVSVTLTGQAPALSFWTGGAVEANGRALVEGDDAP